MKIAGIWINCPSKQIADDVSEVLIKERLIAASNCYPEIESRYIWNGKLEKKLEIPLLVKTRKELFAVVADRVRHLHPHEAPSIIGIDISDSDTAYVAWVYRQTMPAPTAAP